MLLIVDDSRDFTEVLARLLRYHGFEAQTAMSGSDALTWLNVQTPSLILLDVMMPEMSGIDVLRKLRGSDKHADTPVLILTAGCTPQEEQEARRLGVEGMLRKGSIEIGEIVSTIETILAKTKTGRGQC
jgi:DNA-binding response OmpR family regulator